MRRRWRGLRAVSLVLGLAAGVFPQDPSPGRAELEKRSTAARAEMEKLAENAPERPILAERIEILDGLLRHADRTAELAAERSTAEAGREAVARGLENLERLDPPAKPVDPTKAGLAQAKAAVDAQRERLAGLQASLKSHQQRLDQLPGLVAEALRAAGEATSRVARVEEAVAAEQDEAGRRLRRMELENARLALELATRTAKGLEGEAEARKSIEQHRVAELELARRRLERLEASQAAYGDALEQALSAERELGLEEAARREAALEAARTPAERFVAGWEAEIARVRSYAQELERLVVDIRQDVAETEKRLAAERDEFENLRDYLEQAGGTEAATERIKAVFANVKMRREALERGARADLTELVRRTRERRFEIEDRLFGLAERWKAERAEAAASEPDAAREAFLKRTSGLFEKLRIALREEKALCTEVIAIGQQLAKAHADRLATLDALEGYIRAKVFWVQDGKPLGGAVWAPIPDELTELAAWVSHLGGAETRAAVARAVQTPAGAALTLFFFPVLPALLFFARRRVRALVSERNRLALESDRGARFRIVATLGGIVGAALLPAYFWFAGRLAARLPTGTGEVLASLLTFVAIFLFLWFLARSYLGPKGTLVAQYRVDPDAARAVRRGARRILLAFLVCFVPWQILRRPPFAFESIPRIAYTCGEILLALAVWRLIRRRSDFFAKGLARAKPQTAVVRHWSGFTSVFMLLVAGAIAMDAAGYRYGARHVVTSLAWSLGIIVALILAYSGTVLGITRLLKRHREPATAAPGTKPESKRELETQLHGFVQILVFAAGLLGLAAIWGIDRRAIVALDEIVLHTIRSGGEVVEVLTMRDLLVAVIWAVGTVWFVRNLPGIYEVALFARFRADPGVKYAILTISQYMLVAVGFILALGALHLDLGRIGWLIAAMGVGLGFGLQEIVSNFVSGIILLIERPIRVGDLVTINGSSGRVQRINIRSTTILDFDRAELIVPNRSIIAGTVTNLTGSDSITRLVVQVGVAYGSDVGRVIQVLSEIVDNQPEVLADPAPSVVFTKHGDSSLDFDVRVFVPEPGQRPTVQDRLNKEINARFAEEGIEIPFPQRDLHFRSSDVPMPVLP